MVTLVAIAAIVLLIPLVPKMYRASPECAKTVALLAPYCASLPGPLGNSTSLQGACLASSRGVRAAMAGGFTLLHLVTAALLPLPAQPGTEQYWDVRARRALREMLVPTSIERTEIASLLLAPCRALPLQHYCNLSSTWGSERLRWHLDMMHDLLHSDRVTVQSGPGECEGGSCDEEQSCPGGGSAAVRRPVAAAREPRSQERGAARGGAGVASTSGKRSGRGAVSAPRGDQGAKGRRSGYDRLCERQFGVGAMFDGEMCACKSGFAVRKGVCERTPTARAGSSAGVVGGGAGEAGEPAEAAARRSGKRTRPRERRPTPKAAPREEAGRAPPASADSGGEPSGPAASGGERAAPPGEEGAPQEA